MPIRATILSLTCSLAPVVGQEERPGVAPAKPETPPPVQQVPAPSPPAAPVQQVPAPKAPPAKETPPPAPVNGEARREAKNDPEATRRDKERELEQRFLPQPAQRTRLERLPVELSFAPESAAAFAEVLGRYALAWDEVRGEDARLLQIVLPAAYRFDHLREEFSAVHTPELLELLRLRDRLALRIEAAEDALAKEVQAFTPPEQRDAFRRWRLERTQELYGQPAKLPAAGVDLTVLLPKAGLTPEELAPLEIPLGQYTEKLADAIRSRHRRLVELEREEVEALVGLGPEWRAGRTADEALVVDRELAQLAVAETLADMPLRDLNQTTFNALRKQLVPAAARKVTEAYQRVVHPELFEDERSFRLVVEDMLALPTIQQEQISAVVETLGLLEDRLRPASQQAVELADGLIAASKLAPTDAASARILLEGKLQGVLAKRRATVREGLRQLTPLLAADQVAFVRRVDDALATLASQDRAGQFLADALAARARDLAILQGMGEQPAEAIDPAGAPPPATQPAAPPDGSNAPSLGPDGLPKPRDPSEKPKGDHDRRGRGTRRDRPN